MFLINTLIRGQFFILHNQEKFASEIKLFLLKVFPDIRKTQLKIIPYILLGNILSESVVASDIVKKLKNDFSTVQHNSVIKRIRRFFKNKLFDPYRFYNLIIRYIISNYKKRISDRRVHIVFDHMFSHDNFTVFMIAMCLGKQGIPLWFRCFQGKDCSDAFSENLITEGIDFVSSLFNKDEYNLIFLADRWFNSISLLKHIDSLGHTYNIRLKRNIKVFYFNKKENHKIWSTVGDLTTYENHSNLLYDMEITDQKYKLNIAISKRKGVKEPWIIATNGDPKRAIKDYGYRFGAIETIFKSQKSNGFYLENTVNASLHYFESMYSITCLAVLFLTILGSDYTKNSKSYKNVKITTHKFSNGVKTRISSLFNTGLTLFNLAFNSSKYIRIPYSFTLYDL